ncbi:MAG: hypothetical protein PF693_17715 [Spirochaetia bacterium]|jgi:hypothetical protein|nr:hypothetical protein [Spirochaetia bacterium]
MSLLRKIFLFLIITMLVLPAFSEEGANSGFNFEMDIEIGAESINEEITEVSYQMVSINPDFSFGKIGIGLDLTFHYRFDDGNGNFDFREEDWTTNSKRTLLDVYLPIFRYIRYGHKGDSLYGKIGSIEDGTLGNGFIMGNYSNTNFLPELRMTGLALDIDGSLFNFPYVGIETFAGNLAKMDVIGTRLYVRPLTSLGIPIIEDLQIGSTAAFDREPDSLFDFTLTGVTNPKTVSIYGVDFKQPIIANNAISLALFGDLAFQAGSGTTNAGGLLGVGGQLISFINYGLNALILGDNFVPFYFDSAYDLYREVKYDIYVGNAGISGYYGWLANLGFTFLDGMFVFNTSIDGSFENSSNDPSKKPHLKSVFIIGEGLLPGFFFDASYDKRNISDWKDLISQTDAVIGANINYKTGPAVITLGYDLRYVPEDGSWNTTSKLSTSISLY